MRADGTPCKLLTPEFDRSSATRATCMVCHDGSAAPPIAEQGCHPVDVPYTRAWLAGSRALNGIIPAALVLSSGRVTCATCHDGASPYPHRTAVDAASLCTACHAL